MSDSAREELVGLVRSTEAMKQVFRDLDDEPVRLFCQIYTEHEKTGKPVPDHRLPLFSYFAEASLRALVTAGLVKSTDDSRYSLYEYEPTAKGIDFGRRLVKEGCIKAV